MFDIERLKSYIWYIRRVRYLNSFKNRSEFLLDYFERVRKSDWTQEKIGSRDLKVALLPRANPKKEEHTMGSSIPVAQQILKELPREYEKLARWRRSKKVSNKYPNGKIIFSNESYKLTIIQ